MDNQRLKIAVFIDFDNIEIGVKTTLHTQFDIAAILEGVKERGEVVTKVAYGDWKRAGDYGRLLSQHAIRMVQRNLTPGGDKNGADINLALDALEMAFTHDHINAFVIVGGDSDFITLVEKLKQYDKKVFVVGGRQFTSQVMQKNCHEFIAYENLVGGRRPTTTEPKRDGVSAPADVGKVIPLLKRALKVLSDREVSPQLGLLKSTLLQLDSTFSERDYGASTFRDFIEKVAKTGIVTLRHSGRSMLVDAADTPAETLDVQAVRRVPEPPSGEGSLAAAGPPITAAPPVIRDPEQIQQIVDQTKEALNRAGQPPRWPMYVRQMRQYLRTADPNFDEHKWGFATIMEFLRVCQREGLFRLERDRRGQIRVFPGPVLQSAAATTAAEPSIQADQNRELLQGDMVDAPIPGQIEATAGAEFEDRTPVESAADEVIDMDPEPKPAKTRRVRKASASGRPAARKSTGAKTSTRRRKAPVPA
jgi:uncharacterized LabA/DUF88 family protein